MNTMDERYRLQETVANVIGGYLVKTQGDKYESAGRQHLQETALKFIEASKPLHFVLPGFPCKSPNLLDKSFGVLPDLGEVIALKRLHAMAEAINEAYAPGCYITVLSDGTTFNDIVEVSDEVRRNYNRALRELISSPFISWSELGDFFPGCDDDTARKQLIASAKLPYLNLEQMIQRVPASQSLSATHDKLCSYLYNDVRLNRSAQQTDDDYLQSVARKAYEMMYRGMGLSALIERAFPDSIRLSVHQYSNEGPKYTFAFVEDSNTVVQPWHCVPVIALNGQVALKGHAHIDRQTHALVRFDDKPWCYVEVDDPRVCALALNLLKQPTFGLEIVGGANDELQHLLSPTLLVHLAAQFGFLCLRGVEFNEQAELVDFCTPFGNIYQWKFGPVHVVRPDENPDGFVHSLEKTPMHWDLSMLGLDNEKVKQDPWFSSSTFMLYCKTPPRTGEGQTTVVDGRIVLDLVGSQRTREWASLNVTYDTRMTYFGGCPRTYPLVNTHPTLKTPVLRYQEGSESQLQTFTVTVDGVSQAESDSLISEINQLVYDNRCMIAHEWRAGDLIVIDNWQTLHGRLPMTEHSRSRELWRVQMY